ncbi:MAG: hypothetical protein LBB76_06150 [Azoarcus sp.]|nr:hypothetical protein [Azoarcus sp.]
MTKTSFFLSCLLLALNTAMAGSSDDIEIFHAKPAAVRGTSAASTRHVALDRAVAAPRRLVLAPAGEKQVLRALQAPASTQADANKIIAPPRKIGFGRDVAALESPSRTRAQLDWQDQPDGGHAAALAIVSPDAVALRLGLRIFNLPAEALVRVYAPNETTAIVFTGQEITALIALNLAAGEVDENARTWWSPTVEGNETVLEILLPPGIDPAAVDIALPRISHLFASARTGWKAEESVMEKLRETAAGCSHNNVSCETAWDEVSRATAWMVFDENGGTASICTGTLLNDTDIDSAIPYFITARHCIGTQSSASSLETVWFYRENCGSGVLDAHYTWLHGGATLLYESSNTDTAFLRLRAQPPANAAYAAWSASPPAANSVLTGIHHPKGDPQKISFSKLTDYRKCDFDHQGAFICQTDDAANANFFTADWTSGMIEGGSDGSGIFTGSKLLVGTLHGHSGGGCPSNGLYGRFDLAYNDGIDHFLGNADGRWTLRVSNAGNGTGTVTSDVGNIDCGATCSADYADDTTVTLAAAAGPNSSFDGWLVRGSPTPSCPSDSNTCTVTLNDDLELTARFTATTLPTYTLTVESGPDPAGTGTGTVTSDGDIDCAISASDASGICTHDYPEGSVVTLTANAGNGSHLLLWEGDCASARRMSTCTLTMSAARNVTASFGTTSSFLVFRVKLDSDGTGAGRVGVTNNLIGGTNYCLEDCSFGSFSFATFNIAYPAGSIMTLTAIPEQGSHFVGWSSSGEPLFPADCSGNNPVCIFTLVGTPQAIARFDADPTLSVERSGNGQVVSDAGSIDCGDVCSSMYVPDARVTLTATPGAGYVFVGWSGACATLGTTPICAVTMDVDKTVGAVFTPNPLSPVSTHALTVDDLGDGSGTVTCNGNTCLPAYPANTPVMLTATPEAGSFFAGWGGACAGRGRCAIAMNADKTVSATFNVSNVPNPRVLTVTRLGNGGGKVSGAGIDCGSVCAAIHSSGNQVTLTATPEAGSYFSGWGGACAGISPTCVFDIGTDQDITARFDVGIAPWFGDMALRDAIYAYKLPISGLAAQAKTFAAYNCDVFQVLIDVESGFVDLSTREGPTAHGPHNIYPDRLYDTAAMFSYTLYSSAHAKSFRLGRYLDDASSSAPVGTATVFGYCFSTRTDAVVLIHDASTGLCHRNGGITVSCPTVPVALSHPLSED